MLKAYLLIVCEVGLERNIEEAMRSVANVKDVDVVYGEYDLIVKIEVDDIKQLDGVVSEIRRIKGVLRTMTLLCD
ncbi:MAG: Lrp/AsnC ligand binding domain-containing protein [Candidatus Brockarchaeota archaeon]|nr:Lrp/AsnC ligand binding domain-containing protein [Candidatus Brockarchaeota archaeon]MBO3809275.1 Lrp/AsnC ligand binding domain-containing protein [Candidatus Brockarchaeota archaeon]